MKNLIVSIPLFLAPACVTPDTHEAATAEQQAAIDSVSSAAQTAGSIVGGPAVGAAAGAVAALAAGFFIRKRKKAA